MNRHALRTLIKQGNPRAVRFLGFRSNPKIVVVDFELKPPIVKPGQAIELSFVVTADRKESLMIDYIIDFVKSNGNLAPRVHKLKQIELKKGESVQLEKRHELKANATTYMLHPGTHQVTLQINGKNFGTLPFDIA